MKNEILEKTALELAESIKAKKISVPEVTKFYLEIIEKASTQSNNFVTVAKESALKHAEEIQTLIDKGEVLSPLAGVPVALKDNISTMGIETTCASKMLKGYKPVYNAAVTEKLESAGLIIIGKLNMDEFAIGTTSTFDAAAIAIGEVPLVVSTDTSGSLRHSCSIHGTTGIKPTYGSVSRLGIIACASSMDQAGPVGKDINDCAALLSIISGPDNRDSTCIIDKPFDFKDINQELKGKRIGLPKNYFTSDIDEAVKTAILTAVKEFEAAGAIIENFEMPHTEYIIPVYSIIEAAEISSNLAKFDGLKFGYRSPNAKTLSEVYQFSRNEGFGYEVKRKIMVGSLVLSSDYYETYYRKALQARTLIKNAYIKLFEQFDMILSPVSLLASVNLAGLPAVTLPCGLDKQEKPIGMQLIGNAFSEKKLVDAAKIFQDQTNHHKRVTS